jgi:hopanoid-associated phosphorylase
MHNFKTIGFLCGFESEAVVARQISPLVACSGALQSRAYEQAQSLIANGATALISFGVAGALVDHVSLDKVVIAQNIAAANGRLWNCDPTLQQHLKNAAPASLDGTVYGSEFLVPTPAMKRDLYQKTNSLIVDMESHVVADVAQNNACPFAVLRAISDGVNDVFPDAALQGLNLDGSPNIPGILKSLLKNPLQLPALLRLQKHTAQALANLQKIIAQLSI